MKRRAADIIMETVAERGITDCFAVTGGGAMFLDNALYRNQKLRKVFNHHEQACAMAAEAYARYSDRLALVCVTSGPGGTNTLTGVMGAWVDSIPMLVISGQVRYAVSVPQSGLNLRCRGTQEFNITATVKTMTKYVKLVTNPLDVRMEVNKAIDLALSGRRGPVWLDIPMDVQSALVEESELTPNVPAPAPVQVSMETVAELAEAVQAAKRPVLLLGRGISAGGARAALREAEALLQLPIVTSSSAADLVCRENPFYFGSSGTFGPRCGNFIIQNADLILSVGCSLGYASTGFAQEHFAPGASIIAVDVDEDEMNKPGLRLQRRVRCEAGSFLRALRQRNRPLTAPEAWCEYCRALDRRFSPFEAAEGKGDGERVCAYVFWRAFCAKAGEDTICVLGNNTAIIGALQAGIVRPGQRVLGNKNCGSMGYDLPAAIGAALASGREVILVTGDGSVMMNLQELQTIRHYGLKVKIVIFENEGYNAIRQTARNFFHGELLGCTPDSGVSFPSFRSVAEIFGLRYRCCHCNGETEDAVHFLFEEQAPLLLEVRQLLDDPIVPKLMSRALPDGTMAAPALQDMAPFLPREEYARLMSISGQVSGND